MPESAVAELTPSSTPAPGAPSSAAPPSSPATPSTQAATPAAPASERPKDAASLSKFLQAAEAAADATPQTPLVPDSAAAAITPPGTTTPAGVPDSNAKAKGPIPFEVHETALRNAREKAVAEFRQTHWSSKVSEDQLNTIRDLSTRMASDPVGFLRDFQSQLSTHPIYGPQLRSSAGQILATGRDAQPDPDVEIRNEHGQVVGRTYSAEKLAEVQAWRDRQLTGQFTQQLQPLLQDRDQRIAEKQQAEFQQAVNHGADQEEARINRILMAEKQKPDDLKKYRGLVADVMRDQNLSPVDAALHVYEQQVLPALEQSAHAAALDTQRKKAAGNTVSGTGSGVPTTRPTNAKELAKWMEANPGA